MLNNCQYLESFDSEDFIKLETLKVTQGILKDKVDLNLKLDEDIINLINKDNDAKEYIGNSYNIKPLRDKLGEE